MTSPPPGSEDSCHVQPAGCHTHTAGVTPGPCFTQVRPSFPLTPLMSLALNPGGFLQSFIGCLIFFFWLCWVFFAAHGLLSSCRGQGLLFLVVRRLLIAALVTEHSLQARGLRSFRHTGSVVVAMGLCSRAREIFPDQGSSRCSLHW